MLFILVSILVRLVLLCLCLARFILWLTAIISHYVFDLVTVLVHTLTFNISLCLVLCPFHLLLYFVSHRSDSFASTGIRQFKASLVIMIPSRSCTVSGCDSTPQPFLKHRLNVCSRLAASTLSEIRILYSSFNPLKSRFFGICSRTQFPILIVISTMEYSSTSHICDHVY